LDCQPVGNGPMALKYLAPNVFRVAISNKRIIKSTDGKLTFCSRASDTGKFRTCMLLAKVFILGLAHFSDDASARMG